MGLDTATWRVLAKAHNERNLAEYEGRIEIDQTLVADLIRCATMLEKAIESLETPTG